MLGGTNIGLGVRYAFLGVREHVGLDCGGWVLMRLGKMRRKKRDRLAQERIKVIKKYVKGDDSFLMGVWASENNSSRWLW